MGLRCLLKFEILPLFHPLVKLEALVLKIIIVLKMLSSCQTLEGVSYPGYRDYGKFDKKFSLKALSHGK